MEKSEKLTLKGKLFSGHGEGAEYLKLPWVREQIIEKIGFNPYCGTLNIKLEKNSLFAINSLKKAKGIEISPEKGFCKGKCFHAYINNLKCAIVIPEVESYPENIIEVIAPVNLREKFNLRDGDTIKVHVMVE